VRLKTRKFLRLQTSVNHIAHIILAAGASSRMGQPKQLLQWGQYSLIENEILKSLQYEKLSTYVILGANFEIIKAKISNLPVEILHNKNWSSGMGTSIVCGVQHILQSNVDYEGALITLIDQPLIKEKHRQLLLSKFTNNQHKIIATSMKERIGVPAVFPNIYFEELLKLREDYGARYVIKKHIENVIPISCSGCTDDIDTMEDYEALLKKARVIR